MNNIISKISTALVLGLLIIPKINAQGVLTLQQCKQKALEHNQTIKTKQADFMSSEASVKLSKRAMLPNFDLSGDYTYMNDPFLMDVPGFELPSMKGDPSGVYYPGGTSNLSYHNTYNANVGMSLPLYLGGKLSESKKIALQAKAISQSGVALSKTDVLLSIEQQYWSLVSLLEQKKVTAKAISFLTDVVNDMNNRYTIGVVTKNEVLKTKVELNNAKLFQINIENNIALAKMALNQSIGLNIENSMNIADTIIEISPKLNLISFSNDNLMNREEVRILNSQMEIKNSEVKIVHADYLPQVISFANYSYQNPNHLSQNEGELTWNAGLSLSIPVFHWGERKLKVIQAKMNLESSKNTLDRTKELVVLEMHQSIFNLKEALVKLNFTLEALEQSEENLALETNRLSVEVATTTDLLNAQSQWQKAHADYISAKVNVKINEAKYYKSIGALNP